MFWEKKEANKKKKESLWNRLIEIINKLIKIINLLLHKKINKENINKIFQYTGQLAEELVNINSESDCENKLDDIEKEIKNIEKFIINLENRNDINCKNENDNKKTEDKLKPIASKQRQNGTVLNNNIQTKSRPNKANNKESGRGGRER